MLSRLLTTREQFVLLFVALAIGVGGIAYWLADRPPDTPRVSVVEAPAHDVPAPTAIPDPKPDPIEPTPPKEIATPRELAVSIAGAITAPGLYRLPEGSRVDDLLRIAGGATLEADMSDINLAAQLIDGSTLTIPAGASAIDEHGAVVLRSPKLAFNPPQYTISGWQRMAANPETPAVASDRSPSSGNADLININTATQEALETLPGIGEKRAQDIIQYRRQQPFRTVDDLQNIRGIGPKTMESLRSLVTVGG